MNIEMLLNRTNHKIKLINNNFKANLPPIKRSHLFLSFAEWVKEQEKDKEQGGGD